MQITLDVNGESRTADVDDDTPLLWVLRETLGLTGTKFGCGIAACGACTVHVNGSAVRSCSVPASAMQGQKITTIEGLAPKEQPHKLQAAWIAHQVPQCGYCQSGMIMAAAALLARNPQTDRRGDLRGSHQHLPLRHLRARAPRDPCRRAGSDRRRRAMNKWTRRTFIATGGLIGGGLALGVAGIAFAPNRLRVVPDNREGTPQLTTWVKIGADNTVSVIVPHCEMGTGVHTALAMMCAEELDADWSQVRVEEAPGTDDYANGYLVRAFVPVVAVVPKYMERGIDFWTFKLTQMMDLQVTGGSSAVRGTGHLGMRVAGAAAKVMLVEAAAKQWNVPAAECSAKLSKVTHAGSGRTLTYGELAAQAALLTPPVHPPLKSRDDYTIVGKPTPRIDIPSKVNGSATYGVDVTLPQMLYATIAASPVFGAKLVSVDTAPAEALPGVKKVVKLDNAVAVVADGYWRALKGVRALAPKFEDTGKGAETSDTIYAAIGAALDGEKSEKLFSSGKGSDALQGAAKVVEAEYRVPFLRARDHGADERDGAHRRRSLRSVDRRAGSARARARSRPKRPG